MKKKKLQNGLRLAITGLPLMAVIVGSLLPLQKLAQQSLMLFILLWIQVFFIFNFFVIDK